MFRRSECCFLIKLSAAAGITVEDAICAYALAFQNTHIRVVIIAARQIIGYVFIYTTTVKGIVAALIKWHIVLGSYLHVHFDYAPVIL